MINTAAILISQAELEELIDRRIEARLRACRAVDLPEPTENVLLGYVPKRRLTSEELENDAAWESYEDLRARQLQQVTMVLGKWLEMAKHPRESAVRERLQVLDFHNAGDFYFFKPTPGDLIKIGTSTNIPERLVSLRNHGALARLECLAYGPGGIRVEHFLHFAFREQREDGEWFRPTPVMLNLIERCAATKWIWE